MMTLKKGDRVAIVGDSITQQKLYSRFMEDYFAVCMPQLELWVVQLGQVEETAGVFVRRMDQDLMPLKPTVVTTCYGMNDGGYAAYAEKAGATYEQSMRTLVEKVKASGARVLVGSPGAVDSLYFLQRPRRSCDPAAYNETLGRLTQIARKVAGETGSAFANVHDPLMSAMTAAKDKLGAEYAVCGIQGVHPGPNGHLVMAYAFLKSMGLDGQLGTITIDMDGQAQATEGHRVVSSAAGSVEIESARYPFCFLRDDKDPGSARSILPFVPFNQDLNRLMLVVNGLKAEKAKVTWGGASRSFTRDELARGVNLAAEFPDNPFCEPFKKVDAAVAAKQDFETRMVLGGFHDLASLQKTFIDDAEAAATVKTLHAKLIAKHEILAKTVRDAVVPVRHKIAVTAE
jgi:lysophospholipase L1-like esterase